MEPISAWTAIAQTELEEGSVIAEKQSAGYGFKIIASRSSLWIVAEWPGGGRMAFRPVFSAGTIMETVKTREEETTIVLDVKVPAGCFKCTVQFPDAEKPMFRYTTVARPETDLLIPYYPRDIMPLFKGAGKVQNTAGTIHSQQVGTRTGALYFSFDKPQTGSVFYMQNLTALSDYCEDTETSVGNCVGGQWPEIGFQLPLTKKNKPLKAGKEYVISDAFVLPDECIPKDNYEVTRQYMNYLAEVYLLLPKPVTQYRDWLDIVEKGLDDLIQHKGCWKFADGRSYLNAYVSDYKTPPEIMVQLAVLMPLIDHDKWTGEDHHPIIQTLLDGLGNFYYEHVGTVVRWLPAWEDRLDWSEEQKRPEVMDSWYLHHPLMNLARLALQGNKDAKELVLKSIDYAIKVARHFEYKWPVFYKMTTLEVLKAETEPGQGGELDVAGSYAHLMLLLWELTGEKRFFNEAVAAAKTLDGLGFEIFYQANNTAFTAGAMLKLYKETKDELFLNLSYVCLASILKNVQLWECKYGHGKNLTTFFAIYPLKDAPYTAAYEEQEVFSALHDYLKEAEGLEILPSVKLMLAELIKYAVNRLVFYYPPMLPREMLAQKDEVKTGEIDPNLWIALEDIQDGWNASGQVGQEVYGAGIAFGIVPRQYHKTKEAGYIVFTDYPVTQFKAGIGKSVSFTTMGDERLTLRIVLIPVKDKLPALTVTSGSGKAAKILAAEKIEGKKGFAAYTVSGNTKVKIIPQQ